jgi:hypothetical protein
MRCPAPLDAGPANGGEGLVFSLETTVARTMISATGTSQLAGLPPAQEQAWARRADSDNAAAIKPIRNRTVVKVHHFISGLRSCPYEANPKKSTLTREFICFCFLNQKVATSISTSGCCLSRNPSVR